MEFMFPVRYTGVGHKRVIADNLESALKMVKEQAETTARYDIPLSDVQVDILAPELMLTEEEKETWPFWEYGYTGTDGVDWRTHYTRDGRASIPDYAEESHPVPGDWIESWKEEK